jgi:hypothetical protein
VRWPYDLVVARPDSDSLKLWWQTQLAVGLVGLVVCLIVGEWGLAALFGFIALYAGLIMRIKARRARGAPWS